MPPCRSPLFVSGLLAATAFAWTAHAIDDAELAGIPLAQYPHFQFVLSFNGDSEVFAALDLTRRPELLGETADFYVVESQELWTIGDPLVDASSGVETHTFVAADIVDNTLRLASAGELSSDSGLTLGMGYDVVVDVDQDGVLSETDLVDGAAGDAGLYMVPDLVAAGPLAVEVIDYTVENVTSGFSRQRTYYPSLIEYADELPLVMISHGNGHSYNWYDYLQEHLASFGYIVMSHQNNTRPGIETASTTTLEHIEAIIEQQDVIGSGVLGGHIDKTNIVWIGHSRGGEGVARAYDRIVDGDWIPQHFSLEDIVLVSSIAPTDFLETSRSNPHGVPYHLLYGSADGDVCGCPNNGVTQSFRLLERATGYRQSTYIHGADHNDFNCCGFEDFQGPPGTAIGRAEAQRVTKAVYRALIAHYVDGSTAAKDYLWRQWESFKPMGVSENTVVVSEYKKGGSGKLVIDDFESEPSPDRSSSGGWVDSRNSDLVEGKMDDNNTAFTWIDTDPFNGMTRAATADQNSAVVFSIADDGGRQYIAWKVGADASAYDYLSFRAAQGPRHPNTTDLLQDASLFVVLIDQDGDYEYVNISAYGGGIEEPYQRTGYGVGAGWQAEMETIRIRLDDFLVGKHGQPSSLDMTRIRAVALLFLGAKGAARIAVDDLELVID